MEGEKKSIFCGGGGGEGCVGKNVGISCPNRDNGLDLWKERR